MSRHALLAAVALMVVAVIVGCASVPSSGTDNPDGSDAAGYAANSLDLSDTNNQSLDRLTERFRQLATDQSDAESAAALVAELENGFAGVSATTLGADGTTVYVQMSDGAVALLNTNRSVFGSDDSSESATSRAISQSDAVADDANIFRAKSLPLAGSYECPNHDTPSERSVLIINAAAVSNPSTDDYVQQIQDALIAQGWEATAFAVRTRAGAGDGTFAPTSLTQAEGYGLVFVIGQGCTANINGVQHSYIQCCKPGIFTSVLTAGDLADALDERDEGRLIRCETPSESGGFVSDIYARDDYLADKIRVTPGALVYFVAPHSWPVASGLASDGAGATLGWDGAFEGTDGQRTVLGMISRMTANNTYTTDRQAYANLMLSGLGLSHGPLGAASQARIAGTAGDFYLPAWGVFTVDTANLPADAVQVEVEVTYTDCPDFLLSFTMDVSDTIETLRMPAGMATVDSKALNTAGEVVGSGSQKVPLNGGRTDIEITICKATVSLNLTDYPQSGPSALADIRVEFIYPATWIDVPPPVELALPAISTWSDELWAGTVTVESTGTNADGEIIGEQTREVDIGCGKQTIDLCFGWAVLEATRYPPDTASISVVTDSDNAPGPFTFAPGDSVEVYGLPVDETVLFAAEALDADGNILASQGESVAIECGENDIPLDLFNYGIVVAADPDAIDADGTDSSQITATLRYWRTGDTKTPTGQPVAGKTVEFGTTLGTLSGTNPATSNASGQATIQLSGTVDGLATVIAVVDEDLKEGKCAVQIGTGNGDYTLTVSYAGQGQAEPGAYGVVVATVKERDGRAAPNVPINFLLVAGSLQLDEPLETLTDEDGHAEVIVRSDSPAIGLIEVTVPDAMLVKHCIAYLQFTLSLSRTTAAVEIDNGELLLNVKTSVSVGSLGLPYFCVGQGYARGGRLTRGGTDAEDYLATIQSIPNADTIKVWRASEPGTSAEIYASVYCEVDGDWQELSWVNNPSCLVSFYQDTIATLPVVFETNSRLIDNVWPNYYEAKVVARFAGSGPAGNIRYIVTNPDDEGQVTGNWYDGNNRLASNATTPISLVINQETYRDSAPPDSWIAQTLEDYEDRYGGLSISISSYPRTVIPLTGDLSGHTFDPWSGW